MSHKPRRIPRRLDQGDTGLPAFDPALTPDERWADSRLQFTRLLAEVNACGLTPEQVQCIADSMDVEPGSGGRVTKSVSN